MVWLISPNVCFLAVSDKPEHSGTQPETSCPSADAVCGSAEEEEGSCEKGASPEVCSPSPEPGGAGEEPQSQAEPPGLDEASSRTSALQETDDSDDDPVLIPGARYRGGPGHRWGGDPGSACQNALGFIFFFFLNERSRHSGLILLE